MRTTAAITAFVFFCSLSTPAFSQNPTPAAVVGFRTTGTNLETQFRTYLLERLQTDRRITLAADEPTGKQVTDFVKSQETGSGTTLSDAKANFVRGKRLYEQLEVDEAIKALSLAVNGYRELIPTLKDNRELLSSHLYLGMALVIRGSLPEGKAYIRQMIILDPSRAKHLLPQKEFPPKIVQLHRELTQEVSKGPVGSISITSNPSGATVYFDAVQQEPTPLKMQNVPVGEHFIVLEKKGFGRFNRRIDVKAGENTVDESLQNFEPLAPYPYAKRSDPVANDQLRKIASTTQSSLLILGNFAEDAAKPTASVQLYDARSGEFSKIETVNVDKAKMKKSAEELAKKISNNVTDAGLVVAQIQPGANDTTTYVGSLKTEPSKSPAATSQLAEENSPFYKTWWFWTIVGAAAVTGGVLVLTRGSPDHHVLQITFP
jgi:hypothetical protein